MSEATFSVAVAEVESAREVRARSLKIDIVMENLLRGKLRNRMHQV